jgi:uncharacterized damage-inducible protein DinB
MLIQTLQTQYSTSFGMLRKNLEGFNSQNAIQTPEAGGNSATWLLSHIVATRQTPVLFSGGTPIWQQEQIQRWGKSPAPLEANENTNWDQLVTDLHKSQESLMAQLQTLQTSDLEKPTPFGPLSKAIPFFATHEAYHVGQLAMLRRALGMPGMMP